MFSINRKWSYDYIPTLGMIISSPSVHSWQVSSMSWGVMSACVEEMDCLKWNAASSFEEMEMPEEENRGAEEAYEEALASGEAISAEAQGG